MYTGDCKPMSLSSFIWSVADLLRGDYNVTLILEVAPAENTTGRAQGISGA